MSHEPDGADAAAVLRALARIEHASDGALAPAAWAAIRFGSALFPAAANADLQRDRAWRLLASAGRWRRLGAAGRAAANLAAARQAMRVCRRTAPDGPH